MTLETPPTGSSPRPNLDRLLRPRSVAIVGASPNPTSFGACVLANLKKAAYAGEIYLINPRRRKIDGSPCLSSVDALPAGVDCAVLAIPGAGVLDAVEACGRRGVGSVIIFSAGFAESGPEGRAEQEKIAALAHAYGMIVEGPNCLGIVNFVDGVPLTFVLTPPARYSGNRGIAVASQSGAMAAVVGVGLRQKQLGVSFSISTGNEAASNVEDYVEYLVDDQHTGVILMVVEHFRNPQKFLRMAARARSLGTYIVLLHPGRCRAARISAVTHTGAMAGDYQVMKTRVEHAGVVVVETLEELLDVSEILVRCPSVPAGGAAVLTESGAFKALTLDLCDALSLPLPPLSELTAAALRQVLPDFIPPANPLDLTAQALVDPGLYGRALPLILNDDRYGSLVLGIILTDEATSDLKLPLIIEAVRVLNPSKPIIFAALDEGAPVSSSHVSRLRSLGVPFFPSPERAFRALARLTSHIRCPVVERSSELDQTLKPSPGVMAEYQSKALLASFGIPIPAGELAITVEEAQLIAMSIGYPVVLKAQSPRLPHKSDIGGIALDVASPEEIASAWRRICQDVSLARPGLVLDGVLVEKMSVRGLELIIGVRNDPDWGAVLLIGFGGVLAEALNDVRLVPTDLSVEAIQQEFYRLKCAALLDGFRGSPALDVRAAAEIVQRLGRLVLAAPQIKEVEINPLIVYPRGRGAMALDALIVSTH